MEWQWVIASTTTIVATATGLFIGFGLDRWRVHLDGRREKEQRQLAEEHARRLALRNLVEMHIAHCQRWVTAVATKDLSQDALTFENWSKGSLRKIRARANDPDLVGAIDHLAECMGRAWADRYGPELNSYAHVREAIERIYDRMEAMGLPDT